MSLSEQAIISDWNLEMNVDEKSQFMIDAISMISYGNLKRLIFQSCLSAEDVSSSKFPIIPEFMEISGR
jgi:hypothetical protein